MQQAKLKTFWKQHPTKQQLCGHFPSISKTILVRQDMRDTAREVKTNSLATFCYGSLYLDVQALVDKLELI